LVLLVNNLRSLSVIGLFSDFNDAAEIKLSEPCSASDRGPDWLAKLD
jgi:hypothetical protein